MNFKEVIGNTELIAHLKSMVDENRVSHALLFIEEEGQGAMALVLALIHYMSCGEEPSVKFDKLIHPDLHFSFPISNKKNSTSEEYLNTFREVCLENPYFREEDLNSRLGIEDKLGAISVTEAKSIIRQMTFKSYEGGNKYMVIYLPERMSAEASNRLLKLIEEPSEGTYFFLITHAAENVISTIRSRCLRINLRPMETDALAQVLSRKMGIDSSTARNIARTSGGNFGKARDQILRQDEMMPFLRTAVSLLKSCIQNDLEKLMEISAELASYGREKQKNLFLYMENFLRKTFISRIGAESIAYSSDAEKMEIDQIKNGLPEEFLEKAFQYIDDARKATESNVNAKMVFNNLVNLLFMSYLRLKKQ